MPKYRQLYTKIVDSYDVADMPDDFTRLFYILLFITLDSAGRGIDNAAWLRSKMFPLRVDVEIKQIEDAMSWLENREMIVRYEVEGKKYFMCPSFCELQTGLDKETPSSLPAPELLQSKSGATPELLQSNSAPMQCNAINNATSTTTADADSVQGEKSYSSSLSRITNSFLQNDYDPFLTSVFSKVTRLVAIPGSHMSQVLAALEALRKVHTTEQDMTAYLKPFFEEWLRRGYSKSNCSWLIDWAIAGEIPAQRKDKPKVDNNKMLLEKAAERARANGKL